MRRTSTKPKGSTSYKETKFGIIPRSKLLPLEIKGTQKGLKWIHRLIRRNQNVEISPELISDLHRVAYAWIFPNWAGKYRKIQVTVSGKETPPFYKIPEMIVNVTLDLKERLKALPENTDKNFIVEVVKLLAWFQHQFVLVHPFPDYNGRTARMLTILLLLKLKLPPVEIKVDTQADRKRYINAMMKADAGDISLLENIISQTVIEGLNL